MRFYGVHDVHRDAPVVRGLVRVEVSIILERIEGVLRLEAFLRGLPGYVPLGLLVLHGHTECTVPEPRLEKLLERIDGWDWGLPYLNHV